MVFGYTVFSINLFSIAHCSTINLHSTTFLRTEINISPSEACAGGKYLDQERGCLNCEPGSYSAGGTAESCTKCEADRYSAAGAIQCTVCPADKGVAAGVGKQESDCKWSEFLSIFL